MNIYLNFTGGLWKVKQGIMHLFIEFAETYIDKEKVRIRWKEWLEYEAGVMKAIGSKGR